MKYEENYFTMELKSPQKLMGLNLKQKQILKFKANYEVR